NQFIKASTAVVLTASTAVGALPVGVEASGFKDVKADHYFYDAVMSLTERGIVKGYSDGTFRPNQSVTRGQVAKIMAGVLKLDTENVENPNFKDVPTTHPYYKEIAALKKAGIINGFPDGTFKSSAPIERNHIAKILAMALNLKAENEDGLPFTDVSKGYKSYIAALYDNGITTGTTATTFGGKNPVMRGQLAAFIGRAEKITPAPAEKKTLEIIEIEGTTLVTVDKTYEISTDLQTYLTDVNNASLQGAVVEAEVEGGKITTVESLSLNQSGTADKALVFNGGNAEIVGDLMVNGDYIEVRNFMVQGDVTITEAAATSLTFTNVTINGSTKVSSVNSSTTAALNKVANTTPRLTITITDSQLPLLQVSRSGVTIISESQLAAVEVDETVNDITLNVNVGSLRILTANQFSLTGTGSIETVTINGDTDGQPININWSGTISSFETVVPIRVIGDVSNITIAKIIIPFNKRLEEMFDTEDGKLPNIELVIYPDGTPVAKPGDGGEIQPGPNPGNGDGGTTPGPIPGDGGGGTTPSPGNGGTTPPAFVVSSKTIANTIAELGIVAKTSSSTNVSVATAQILGGNVVISGKTAGTAMITLKDNTGNTAKVVVTVTSGNITTSVTKFYKNTTEKLTNTFEVLGLINALKASTSDVVNVVFENGTVHFIAKKPGTAAITISNIKDHSTIVNISIASNGKLTIGEIQKYKSTITNSITLKQLGLTKQTNLTFTTDNVAT
ncbi:MAG: S-layer homology domain-containing protein, partial [Lysinibacillus sp.]